MLLEKERNNHQEENKITFNITYCPTFQNTKTILDELQILDKEHQIVFPNNTIVGFKMEKTLTDHLVTASVPILNKTLGSEPCGKRNCRSANLL